MLLSILGRNLRLPDRRTNWNFPLFINSKGEREFLGLVGVILVRVFNSSVGGVVEGTVGLLSVRPLFLNICADFAGGAVQDRTL